MTPRLERNLLARIWDRGDTTTVLSATGAPHRYDGDSAALCRAVLDILTVPHTRDELLAAIVAQSEPSPHTAGVLDALIEQLRSLGAVREAVPRERSLSMGPSRRIVLGLTGAVASAQAPTLVGILHRWGWSVRVVATRKALRFVAADALVALTHAPVLTGLHGAPDRPAVHLDLADQTDLVLVWPASATTLARIASGMFTDAVCATAATARGQDTPVVLAPSMNPRMLASPAVQRNMDTLRDDGYFVVRPSIGVEVADAPTARVPVAGPCPSPEAIASIVATILATESLTRPPTGTADWDALYTHAPPESLPWETDTPDPVAAAALDALASNTGRRLLDIGTGTGTFARAASERGWTVVATDASPRVLATAEQRAPSHSVTWLLDDIVATRLRARFDALHDRGCLHALPVAQHGAYATAVAGLCASGSTLLLTTHAAGSPAVPGTTAFPSEAIRQLFSPHFVLERAQPTEMRGPRGLVRAATLFMLRRV